VAAFDIGGTCIKAGLVRDGGVERFTVVPTDNGEQGVLATVIDLGRRLMEDRDIAAVGVSVKGIVDPKRGVLVTVNEALTSWIDQPICEAIAEELARPVYVENDARMYALGELTHGSGAGSQNLVCLTLGTGIGSGVALGGRILRGATGALGILGGHFTVQMSGPRCSCGNVGCLEALIGAAGLVRRTRELLTERGSSALAGDPLEPQHIFAAAEAGDSVAEEVVGYFADCLGAGIVTMIHAYDPDVVVLGGGVARGRDQFLCRVRAHVEEHAWTLPRGRVPVVPSVLGDKAALIGVAELAWGTARFL
jgi:glucokinase